MKTWTFTTYTIAAFCCSGLAVLLLIVNAVTANAYLSVLLPVAVAALVTAALENGGRDNVTAIVLDVLAVDDITDDAPGA